MPGERGGGAAGGGGELTGATLALPPDLKVPLQTPWGGTRLVDWRRFHAILRRRAQRERQARGGRGPQGAPGGPQGAPGGDQGAPGGDQGAPGGDQGAPRGETAAG